MEEEIWKVYKVINNNRYSCNLLKGDIIEISNLGNVKHNGVLVEFKQDVKYYGYAGQSVHRMVAELFVTNQDNKPYVDHIDGNRYNNRANNLRWVTMLENNNNPITKKRQSESQKGHFVSEETKEKYRQAHLGKPAWNKGLKMSDDFCEKNRQAHLGKPAWNKGLKGLQKGSNTNKHREYDNEEHTKWHMVSNN